jgi:hypothetical protein
MEVSTPPHPAVYSWKGGALMLHNVQVVAGGVLVAAGIGVAYWYYKLRKMERKVKSSRRDL